LNNFWRQGPLDGAHDNILSPFAAATSFVQHAKTLTNAGGVAEKNLQARSRLILFVGFQLLQKLFRSWLSFGYGGHAFIIS
jgi:hypothetical protein